MDEYSLINRESIIRDYLETLEWCASKLKCMANSNLSDDIVILRNSLNGVSEDKLMIKMYSIRDDIEELADEMRFRAVRYQINGDSE